MKELESRSKFGIKQVNHERLVIGYLGHPVIEKLRQPRNLMNLNATGG